MPTSSTDRRYITLAFRIMAEFGVGLAVPAVAAAWAGTRLDAAYGTKRFWLVVLLLLAAALSARFVWVRAKAYGKEYQAIGDDEKRTDK